MHPFRASFSSLECKIQGVPKIFFSLNLNPRELDPVFLQMIQKKNIISFINLQKNHHCIWTVIISTKWNIFKQCKKFHKPQTKAMIIFLKLKINSPPRGTFFRHIVSIDTDYFQHKRYTSPKQTWIWKELRNTEYMSKNT